MACLSMPMPSGTTCPRCLREFSADDMVESSGVAVAHVDCRRPRGPTHQERSLLYGYCWAHPIVCPVCGGHFQLFELAADRFEPHRRTTCPRCRAELIETVREHLYTCNQSPEVFRRRAREARETARNLVKQARALRDRADVLMREAEVGMTQLRDTTNQSASEALRGLVRAKLHDGSLPRDEILAPITGTPGDGSTCRACEHPITDRQLMMLLPAPAPFPLHADCFQLWSEERRTFMSSD